MSSRKSNAKASTSKKQLKPSKNRKDEESDIDMSDSTPAQSGGGAGGYESRILPQYRNAPVEGKSAEAKLKQLQDDMGLVVDTIDEGLTAILDAAVDVATLHIKDNLEENDPLPMDPAHIVLLDTTFRSLLDKREELIIRQKTLKELRQKFAQGHQIRDVGSAYEDKAAQEVDVYHGKTSRQKYAVDELYINFRGRIFETMFDRGVPPMKDFIAAEANDEVEDSDEEISVKAQQLEYRCPITLSVLTKPVKSTKCRHVFSQAAILQVIGAYTHVNEYLAAPPPGHAPCPVSGCPAHLSAADMIMDTAFEKRVAAHVKRAGEREATQKKGTQYMELDSDEDEDD